MIGASLDTVKGWTREKNPSPISQQFKTRIMFATGALIKKDSSVVAEITPPPCGKHDPKPDCSEPFTKETFDFWRTRIFKSNEVLADRCVRHCTDSLRRIFHAASQPVRGKRNLPAVWNSFCDWYKDTKKKFNLSSRLEKMEKDYEVKTLQEDIFFGLHRLITRENARLPACRRLTQSEVIEKTRARLVEIGNKLAVSNKKPAMLKSRA